MRANGIIHFLLSLPSSDNGCDLNEFGEVASSSEEWSRRFSCNISTNSDNRTGRYEEGQFRRASFTILVEDCQCLRGQISRVKLRRGEEDLGEYQVQSVERLPSVGRVRIIV